MDDAAGLAIAYEETKKSYEEGGIPSETATLQNAGRLPAPTYSSSTIYTTLSPCDMCTGAILLYKIPRVVIGENRTFKPENGGGEDYLRERGVEVVVVDDEGCRGLMERFVREKPGVWWEDICEVGEVGKREEREEGEEEEREEEEEA
ncbi:cytidine deaminase-like protein [Sordaria sp. MPI-SDFR-AT-0083]|nr:cytidine deaminase-like protein [Sordaria sp. MPI-SDFR-AT-0083]